MWIKIGEKLYNTDYISQIWQEEEPDPDKEPGVKTFARPRKGWDFKISEKPILQDIVRALNAKEVR